MQWLYCSPCMPLEPYGIFCSCYKGLIIIVESSFLKKLDSEKKEWLIPQTSSIRERSHSYLGGTTSYGGFNGKITITLFFHPGQEKK